MSNRFPWLDYPPLAQLLQALNSETEEARVVGGAVRNTLLGEPAEDWDIATTASPNLVTARCQAKGWKVVPTGLDHGTVTVVVDAVAFEVTTLREDLQGDGRRAVVRFGRDFRADALRRDFTINALSVSADGTLHDYTGGEADIASRRVRFIGNAEQRIREDYLRILRLFRFHARYGQGQVDAEALAAAIRERRGLAKLSRERIHHEILRLVMAPHAAAVLAEMEAAGILLAVLGGITLTQRFAAFCALPSLPPWEPQAIRRLAALALLTKEDATRLSDALRLSALQGQYLANLAAAGEPLHGITTDQEMRRLAYRFGQNIVVDAAFIRSAHTCDARWQKAIEKLRQWTVPELPWSGRSVAALGIPPGPTIGAILLKAEQAWVAEDFCEDAAKQKAILEDALAAVVPQASKEV